MMFFLGILILLIVWEVCDTIRDIWGGKKWQHE